MNKTTIVLPEFPSSCDPDRLSNTLKNIAPTVKQASQLKRVIQSRGLRPLLDSFLYTRHHNEQDTKFYAYYVRNTIDDFLEAFSNSTENSTKVIVGPAGSGKSASLRNSFGLSVSPSIVGKNLIVPFYFDNLTEKSEESCRNHISNQLFSATKLIQNSRKITFTPQRTVEFIEGTKDSLVAYATIGDEALSQNDAFKIIEAIKDAHYLGLAISTLKQALKECHDKGNPIERVFFVADDLESMIDNEVVAKTVACILSMQTCMENMGGYKKPSTMLTLLSLRPATFEVLQGNADVNAFDIPDSAEHLQPIELRDMFSKRLNENLKDLEIDAIEQRDNWATAHQIIERICKALSHSHAKFFLGITNYNIRLACKLITRIIENSHWYEAVGDEESGAYGTFKLSDNQYHITQAALVRTIALTDHSVYTPNKHNGIPNLFFGANIFPAIIVGPYIAKRFMHSLSGDGYSVIDEAKLAENLKLVIDEQIIDQVLGEILEYFVKYGFLRRIQIDTSKLVSQPSMLTVWRHMSKSSILFECYRDSTALKHYCTNLNHGLLKASADLGGATFLGAIDFILNIVELERRALERAKITKPLLYISLFGPECISCRLLRGIEQSIKHYGQWNRGQTAHREAVSEYLNLARREVQAVETLASSLKAY